MGTLDVQALRAIYKFIRSQFKGIQVTLIFYFVLKIIIKPVLDTISESKYELFNLLMKR